MIQGRDSNQSDREGKGKSRILVAPFANQGNSPPGRRKQRLRQMLNEALLRGPRKNGASLWCRTDQSVHNSVDVIRTASVLSSCPCDDGYPWRQLAFGQETN